MSLLEAANSWISNNQALVVSVGLPVFTLVITGWASFLSHKAKVSEVRLGGHIKLSEYRRANYDELLRLSGRLQALFMDAATDVLTKPADSNYSSSKGLLDVVECTNLFLLRSHADEDQIDEFTKCIEFCCHKLFSRALELKVSDNDLGRLRTVCKEILDKEWEKIERELKVLTK